MWVRYSERVLVTREIRHLPIRTPETFIGIFFFNIALNVWVDLVLGFGI